MKHTPGPWQVRTCGPNQMPTVGPMFGLIVSHITYGTDHPAQANARLIAAAPDLLEALKNAHALLSAINTFFTDSYNIPPQGYDYLHKVLLENRSAIEKAEMIQK